MFQRIRHCLSARRLRPRLALALILLVPIVATAVALGGTNLWFERRMTAAEKALNRRDYEEAQRQLDQALRIRPNDARAHFLAGRTARRAGKVEPARQELKRAEQLGYAEDRILLEHALLSFQDGDRGPEEYLRRKVETDDPDALLILEVLIQEYLKAFQLWEAKRCCDQYLNKRPDDVQALLGRAYVWERLFYYASAVLDCRRAVDVDPGNDYARLRLAENLVVTGPASEAVEQFELLRRVRPDSDKVLLGLARARMQLAQCNEARQILDELLELQPQHAQALSERGKLLFAEGDAAEAEPFLRRALAEEPHDRQTLYNLVQCLDQLGRTDEAAAQREKLEQLDADMKGIALVTKEIQKRPHDPALRTEGGELYIRLGEEMEGLRWLGMALRIDSHYRPAHQALAAYYQSHGQPALADEHRRLAQRGATAGQ
jgi:tetratricopeptide (TPR) repeat protein